MRFWLRRPARRSSAGGTLPAFGGVFRCSLLRCLAFAGLAWLEKRRPALQNGRPGAAAFFSRRRFFTMLDANKNGARCLTDYAWAGYNGRAPGLPARRDYIPNTRKRSCGLAKLTFQGQTRKHFLRRHPRIRVQAVTDFLGAYKEEISHYVFDLPRRFWQAHNPQTQTPEVIDHALPGRATDSIGWAVYVEDSIRVLENESAGGAVGSRDIPLDGEEADRSIFHAGYGKYMNVFDAIPGSAHPSAVANPLVVGVT